MYTTTDDYHPVALHDPNVEGAKGSYKIQPTPAEIVDLTNCNVCQVYVMYTYTYKQVSAYRYMQI